MGKGSTRHVPQYTPQFILAQAILIARERGFESLAQALARVAHQSDEGDPREPADERAGEGEGSPTDTE